jgi:predicted dehydrogenase
MNDLRFAIIGCGRIGQRHAGHIQNSGCLVAVCDIDANKASELGAKHNAQCYTSFEELLAAEKDLDVIAICTPNGLHAVHSAKGRYKCIM